jgi:hypothetical protein
VIEVSKENAERERDFYMTKLRTIELLCTSSTLSKQISIDKVLEVIHGIKPAENTVLF